MGANIFTYGYMSSCWRRMGTRDIILVVEYRHPKFTILDLLVYPLICLSKRWYSVVYREQLETAHDTTGFVCNGLESIDRRSFIRTSQFPVVWARKEPTICGPKKANKQESEHQTRCLYSLPPEDAA